MRQSVALVERGESWRPPGSLRECLLRDYGPTVSGAWGKLSIFAASIWGKVSSSRCAARRQRPTPPFVGALRAALLGRRPLTGVGPNGLWSFGPPGAASSAPANRGRDGC